MFAQKEGLTVLCISFLVYKSIQPIRSRLDINQFTSESSKLNKTDVPNWKYLDNLWNEERYFSEISQNLREISLSFLILTRNSVSRNSKICSDKPQSKA